MAVTADKTIVINLAGDVVSTNLVTSATNKASSGQIQEVTLSIGFNAITLPTNVTNASVTILPPAGNTTAITLKGVTGDTGIALHLTEPTTIGLAAGAVLGLTVSTQIIGVRYFWT